MDKHEQWTSKLGFILAAAGSAIGLGAIWKFPYMAGTNGGGIFLILFLLMTIFIGAPILLAEFIIGRNSQKDAVMSYKHLAPKSAWPLVGYGGVIASFIILSFYSVVGGWILSYLGRSVTGSLSGLTQAQYGSTFERIIAHPVEAIAVQFLFMLLTIGVVQGGVQQGIEKASKYMMPALFVIFIVLVIRSLTLDGAMEGVEFFLKPDWSAVTSETVLLALGQSFFALSVGLSVMVTYASYLPRGESLTKSAFSVVGLNIFISVLAGLVIFPAVFALGFEPEAGPGLVFVVLPAVFEQIAFGGLFLTIFLVLLLFATLTSAFSILEIIVAVLSKGNVEKRKKYAWIAGMLVFAAGIPNALSFGVLAEVKFFGKTFFDLADFITSNIALPLGAFFIAIFAGYVLPRKLVRQELETGGGKNPLLFKIWYFSIRYIVPVGIGIVFLQSIGIL
jgi:neurotransmitter:Na+ symporter, NSS family